MLENKWIPKEHRQSQPNGKGLTLKQAEFLCLICPEALYGGAAGGGKSEALFMAALMFVDIPKYNAIIFRRRYSDLTKSGALIDRSHEWLDSTIARWSESSHIWYFPSGAQVGFGYIENDRDVYQYQSAEYQYEGFDELTQFTEFQYRYMISRLRRLTDFPIPIRLRSASNPGNIGHEWVKQRFLEEGELYGRVFIPAKLQDNPNLDRQKYIESLNELDPITRKQYLEGDWTARHGGSIFKREYFKDKILDKPPYLTRKVRFWDKAATKPKSRTDPSYTVGLLLGEKNGQYYILNIVRFRGPPAEVEQLILTTAQADGYDIPIYMEQEPGSSGVDTIDHYSRIVLQGYTFRGVRTTGSKEERAAPVSSAAEAGNIFIIKGEYLTAFLDELEAFPLGTHNDQVDALSGAFQQLRKPKGTPSFLFR